MATNAELIERARSLVNPVTLARPDLDAAAEDPERPEHLLPGANSFLAPYCERPHDPAPPRRPTAVRSRP